LKADYRALSSLMMIEQAATDRMGASIPLACALIASTEA
jgi:hypothetical protein